MFFDRWIALCVLFGVCTVLSCDFSVFNHLSMPLVPFCTLYSVSLNHINLIYDIAQFSAALASWNACPVSLTSRTQSLRRLVFGNLFVAPTTTPWVARHTSSRWVLFVCPLSCIMIAANIIYFPVGPLCLRFIRWRLVYWSAAYPPATYVPIYLPTYNTWLLNCLPTCIQYLTT